ncbi:aromatic ring-hydroxylating dioxygenase subunit alpha [Burkholderia sp. Ac-20353]|uniref:aromatic ring-hydroxylating oxygenase subunit alpha n=1 Tax=Burkholderia sp. Ac-20353 TaxID=2703894 RepID=UPI00197C4E2B|nr:aromatic ring-hydroxylating dioxygenase subunit alpha [Burkholderia sp. Ac-20353]MBN3788503.1 aromatic ring-hydroxylating dioxygenase subunit alpha [Burkholderia sp. Ac-20353]
MSHNNAGDRKRGHSSSVSPLVCDLLEKDSRPLPAALRASGNTEPGARAIPFAHYWDPEIASLETERIWKKTWQFACREEDIPAVGDRINYDVGNLSFMIVRSAPNEIRAFHNACLHRGTRLCGGRGSGEHVRCPFHGWEWKLDGSLKHIPSRWDFPQISDDEYRLPEAKVGTWGGFVFINPDPNAAPLSEALGVLPAHFESWKPEDRFTFVHVRKLVRANWKVTLEAFLEAYHVIETHADALPFTGDASTQYDIWDDGKSHVSRLITPLGIPSPHLGDDASEQIALDAVTQVFAMAMGPDAVMPTFDASDGRGRAELAAWRRQAMGAALGRDFTALSDAELVDTIQYFMFPNFCPWYGEGLPLTYQFLPYKDNPNESVMVIRLLLPLPGNDVPRPPSAPVVELGFDDTFDSVPQLGLISHIFEQDMCNLPNIQTGLKSASEKHAFVTPGQYQESRISHFHETLDRYLGI